jgi:hypothetical protein
MHPIENIRFISGIRHAGSGVFGGIGRGIRV